MTGYLICTKCGYTLTMEQAMVKYDFREGWPKHCGITMEWRDGDATD